jgi:5'-nucleotidase
VNSAAPINWQSVDTVLLDLDGTLLDLHYDNYFWLHHLPRRWAELTGRSEEECRQYLHLSYNQMRGTLDWYCLDYWSRHLQTDIMVLKREVADKVALRPDAERFLNFLRANRKRVYLVTNAHRLGLELKLALTGIEAHFDVIVSSHDFQVPKEEQAFWQRFHREFPFALERALFIDDNEQVLDSARQFGVGQLIQILQPDMQRPPAPVAGHPAVLHFCDLLDT